MAYGAQPAPIKGIIFDYGRVLAWTQHQEPRAAWERRLGLAPGALTRAVHNEHSWIAAQRGTISIDAHWQEVSTALRLSPEDTVVLRRFDALAISAEIGVMKPDAAAYQAILAMMHMEAHTCVFIDDVPANVAAAQAVGLHGIVFEDNPSCLAALTRLLGPTPSPSGKGCALVRAN